MKSIIIYVSIILSIGMGSTKAQILLSPNHDTISLDFRTDKNSVLDFKKLFKHQFDNTFFNNQSDTNKAKLLFSNQKFDIYSLPIDNMPCLVPNKMFKGNMQTMEQAFNTNKEQSENIKIPNPFKKENLIPRNN